MTEHLFLSTRVATEFHILEDQFPQAALVTVIGAGDNEEGGKYNEEGGTRKEEGEYSNH
jgi:hypothetical protein